MILNLWGIPYGLYLVLGEDLVYGGIAIPWYLMEVVDSVIDFMIVAVFVTMLSTTYRHIIGAPASGDDAAAVPTGDAAIAS